MARLAGCGGPRRGRNWCGAGLRLVRRGTASRSWGTWSVRGLYRAGHRGHCRQRGRERGGHPDGGAEQARLRRQSDPQQLAPGSPGIGAGAGPAQLRHGRRAPDLGAARVAGGGIEPGRGARGLRRLRRGVDLAGRADPDRALRDHCRRLLVGLTRVEPNRSVEEQGWREGEQDRTRIELRHADEAALLDDLFLIAGAPAWWVRTRRAATPMSTAPTTSEATHSTAR